MAQPTEAACLLQTGTQYTRRIGLRDGSGALIFAGQRRGTFSLYFDDEPIDHFDLDGRWQRSYRGGIHYLRALDGRVESIDRVREGPNLVLHRRSLSYAEAADLDATVRAAALGVIDGLVSGRFEPISPPSPVAAIPPEELRESLDRIARWDAAAWFAHRERFLATYGPLPFLAPDATQAVVIQATLGDPRSFAFAGASPTEHCVRTLPELEEHAAAVADLWGRRVVQARGIFLAGADALRLPADHVASALGIIGRVFAIDPDARRRRPTELTDDASSLDGISTFLDEFDLRLPDLDAWRLFRSLHLRRVTLGVESGDPEVHDLHSKRWDAEALIRLVANLRAADISVAVVVPVGAGGIEHAKRHEGATAGLIGALDLGPGDLVYLIDAAELGGEPGLARLVENGLTPVQGQAYVDRLASFKGRLAAAVGPKGAKVAPYSLEKQGMAAAGRA